MKEFHQGSCFMSWMKRKQWLRETSAYETEYTVTVCWSHSSTPRQGFIEFYTF